MKYIGRDPLIDSGGFSELDMVTLQAKKLPVIGVDCYIIKNLGSKGNDFLKQRSNGHAFKHCKRIIEA